LISSAGSVLASATVIIVRGGAPGASALEMIARFPHSDCLDVGAT
jgi:hypothetical protein